MDHSTKSRREKRYDSILLVSVLQRLMTTRNDNILETLIMLVKRPWWGVKFRLFCLGPACPFLLLLFFFFSFSFFVFTSSHCGIISFLS